MDADVCDYLNTKFEKLRLLKKSARGEVWLAVDQTGMLVIWKKILYHGLPYRQIKKLTHGLWPKIIYLAEDENETLVIEEYISGHNLQDRMVQKEYLAETEVRQIILQLCQGLAVLHDAGIIHRDIKPANIIWNHGIVRLIDFDVSRTVKETAQEDTTHLGTKGYASPEQFGYGQTNARSDIYALGVTMLELLGPDYHGHLQKILQKCRELDPKYRYSDVRKLYSAVLHERRNRFLRWIGLVLGILVVTLFGCILWQKQHGQDSLPILEKEIEEHLEDGLEKVVGKQQHDMDDTSSTEPLRVEQEQDIESGQGGNRSNTVTSSQDNVVCKIFINGGLWNGSSTVVVPSDIWSEWQWKDKGYTGSTPLPEDWQMRIHLENPSQTVLLNPRAKIRYDSQEHIFVGTSLAPGESEDIMIPLGGYQVSGAWNSFDVYLLIDSSQTIKQNYFSLIVYLDRVGEYRQALAHAKQNFYP